jgi:hypothetical protein
VDASKVPPEREARCELMKWNFDVKGLVGMALFVYFEKRW